MQRRPRHFGGSCGAMLLLYSIAIGLILGRLLGGRLGAIERIRIHWWAIAVAGFLFQLALFSAPIASRVGDLGPPAYVISTLLVMAALLRNVRLAGVPILAIGAALNLVVIIANGGHMPSSPEAWIALNGTAEIPVSYFTNSIISGPETLLPFLGDIFVFPRPLPLANIFSIGDALIAVGGVVFLVAAMRTPDTPQDADDTSPTAVEPATLEAARQR